MAMMGVLLMGLFMLCVMVVCIAVIVVIFSVLVALIAMAIASLKTRKSNNYLLGVKTFIVACSGIICAGFGWVLFYFLTSLDLVKITGNPLMFNIIFSISGLLTGILCALLVNKLVVNPVVNIINKIRDYSKNKN